MASTFTSREFNRDVSAAKRAALNGPVTVTERGARSHVLLSAADYDQLVSGTRILGRALQIPGPDIDLDLPERADSELRDLDL